MAKNKLKLNDPFIRNHPAPEKRIEIYDTHVSGLAVRITKTSHKSFVYRYRFNNKVKRFTIGSYPNVSLAKARQEAGELAYKVSKGIDPQAEKSKRKHQSDPQTFKELAEEFKTKHLPNLKEKTQTEYCRIIDVELIPKLGKKPIDDITKNQIINLLDNKALKDGSPTMANRIRARLSTIYSFGVKRGLAKHNIVQSTPTYPAGKTKRDRYYNENEIQQLWHFFEQLNQPTQSVFKMLLICGQRKTETMNIRWNDIRGNVWTIPAELAKNGQPHDVPLSDLALQIIEDMQPITGESEYVFNSPKIDSAPMRSLKRANRTIKKHSGVPDFRPHDLRRTVATYMAKLAVDRTVLGKILNHKGLAGDGQVTAIYDRHSYMKEKRQALNRWSNHLQGITSGRKEAKITKIA